MKILYVAGRWDPMDHNQASGTDYEIYTALKKKNAEVDVVGPFTYGFSLLELALIKLYRRLFKKRLFKYPFLYFFKSAYFVNQAIKKTDYDLIVSMYSAPIVFARLDKPLLYICDASVKWIRPNWQGFPKFTYLTMQAWEAHVIKKCAHIITFSDANAKVLHEFYNVPVEKITVFAIPASIPVEVIPATIDKRKDLSPVKLLLVGRDYYRKGVDIGIEIVERLNYQGVQAELRIVGLDGDDSIHTKFMGLYNKTIPKELEEYMANYKWANFLIHPARFEAAGIVPSEAAAFGVPTLTNNAGGLATTVEDGVSGRVFPKDSPADTYVMEIIKLVNNPDAYFKLMAFTKKRYENELNWLVAGKIVFQIAEDLIQNLE